MAWGLAAVLSLSACATTVPDAVAPQVVAPPTAERIEEISTAELVELSAAMTTALAEDDIEAWVELLDLDADGVAQQRDWFAGVQAVPMEVREMHVTQVLSRRPLDGASVVTMAFRHQVSGADPTPTLQEYRMVAGRDVQGAVRIIEISGTAHSWDLGPMVVLDGEAVLLLSHAEDEWMAELMLDSIDRAAVDLLSDLPAPGVDRIVVVLTDEDGLATVFGRGRAGLWSTMLPLKPSTEVGTGLTGLTSLPIDVTTGTGRLLIDADLAYEEWVDFGGELPGGAMIVRLDGVALALHLRHGTTRPAAWVSYGFGAWYQVAGASEILLGDYREWYQELAAGEPPTRLPPAEATAYARDPEGRNLLDAVMAFFFVEERWGRERALELGAALHGVGAWHAPVEAVLTEHLGMDLAEFEAEFVSWGTEVVQ